ncbi:hypothetical protein EMCRGX_G024687 [Ephydatia muelleri]
MQEDDSTKNDEDNRLKRKPLGNDREECISYEFEDEGEDPIINAWKHSKRQLCYKCATQNVEVYCGPCLGIATGL